MRAPVGRARLEQRGLVREVRVDGVPLDAGALGDRGDGRARRADGRVQLDGGLDDAMPCLRLPFCPALELVPSSSLHTSVLAKA